ncbi:PAS domain-containing sensor histidine kinase [Natrinema sp. CBA1119]|uniref:PAS domain-containing sensor histidine kinase n=1 Tax=Natrinema sp. CBA1119 TaxID=1608465 RepID=UPI000BFA5C62|nr:PAS domain S-box protein [Natrinema sp. CBA1119]PGF15246.1 PAS domain-containing sensor histidine kinase [Natrinema sp. CBA1119]
MSTRAGADGGAFWGDADDDVALHRYRTLVNTIDDGIYQVDTDGRFVAVNDVIVEATGYTRDELLGEHVSLVLADSDIERIEREISSRIDAPNDDDIATFDITVRTVDGDTIPYELRINLLLEDGTFRGSIGVARNRTEEQCRQESLASAVESYDSITSIIDKADIGVCILDENCEITWADETIEQYFALDHERLIGRNNRTVIDETLKHRFADADSFAETVLSSYDDDHYVDRLECRVVDDGTDLEDRWLRYQSKPIESGEFSGGRVEFYYDITDQKQSEEDLEENREAFQSLVDAVEEYAIFRLDADGHVLTWNRGARTLKGYDREEIVGEHFSTFYTDADRAANVPERNLERALETGSAEDEGWRVREDGTRFWANVTITPVRDGDGTHRGYLKVTRDMTDRWEREQELESELQRILGRISDAFYAVDDEFRFTHVNERAAELLQHTEEELLGEQLWEVFPDLRDLDEVWDAFHTALETQEPTSYELYYDTLDFRVEANLYPSETGISVYFRDVTERREREQELEQTERRFEAIFEDPNILVGLLEPDGTVLDINGTAMEYIDADLADVTGEPFWETPWWGEGEDVRSSVREWTERAAAGEYVNFEADLTRPDGEQYTLNGVFRPVTNDEGDVVSIVVSDRDVTERKKRERELEESEQRYRTLAEHFPNGVVTLFDHDLEYTLVAGQGFDKIPVDPAEAEGEQFDDVWPEETSEMLEPALRAALEGEERTVELEYAGREWVIYSVPITDTRGDVFAGVTMAHDITERKEYQRRLEETIDRLEESNRRLEQFAYAASHDLQEPLRMVSSYLQLIESRYADELDEDGEEFLAFAVDGADRMRDMIDGLLAYSRVETQGDPIEPVDLDSVLESVLADLQLQIEETDAEITTDTLPRAEGDAAQLRQVFQNLLSNALEYSGDEPPQVSVDAERRGREWVISVHDEGIGIDPDDQERVFEVFQRLHSREKYSGTGIGLALCQRIIERHGGEIWVDSEPGEGATFSFTLPAADDFEP